MKENKTAKSWNGFSAAVLILLFLSEAALLYRIWKLHMLPSNYFLIVTAALVLVAGLLCLLLFRLRPGKREKRVGHGKQILGYLLSLVVIAGCFLGQQALGKVHGTIQSITAPEKVNVVLEIYVRADDPAEFLQDTAGYSFALPEDISGEELAPVLEDLKALFGDTLTTVSYPNTVAQMDALLSGEVDALVLNSAYLTVLESLDGYGDYEEKVKLLHEKIVEKEPAKRPPIPARDKLKEDQSLLVYISGSDSRRRMITDGRNDVNILAAVNLKTHQILLVNTPRDTYLANPASGNGSLDKLTHCGLHGVENSVAALEGLYGHTADYYARINFSGFETLVDAIGGVTVYSDYSFGVGRYYIRKGENHLNGDYALFFAQHRKTLPNGDFDRGRHQMKLIEAIINKMTAENLIANYAQILESLEGMFSTNLPAEELGKLVQHQLEKMPKWEIFSVATSGQGGSDRCWAAGGGYAYVLYPSEQVVDHISGLIEKVLEGEKITQSDLKTPE